MGNQASLLETRVSREFENIAGYSLASSQGFSKYMTLGSNATCHIFFNPQMIFSSTVQWAVYELFEKYVSPV